MKLLWLSLLIGTYVFAQTVIDNETPVMLLPTKGTSIVDKTSPPLTEAQTATTNNKVMNQQNAPSAQQQMSTTSSAMATPPWSGYAAAESLATNGNPELALKQLDGRLKQAPNDAKAAYLKGLILMQLGRGDDAERWFIMMQSNFPKLPQPYNALAVIYTSRGDLQSAENTLRTLLVQHPDNYTAQVNLGNIYVKLAHETYQKALKAKPNDAMIVQNLKTLEQIDK